MGSLGLQEGYISLPISTWVRNYIRFFILSNQASEENLVRFIATLWRIWRHRNETVFRNTAPSLENIVHNVADQFSRCWKFMEGKKKGSQRSSSSNGDGVSNLFWTTGNAAGSPPVRLQVDGAWKKVEKRNLSEWVAGAGWFASWEGNQREGKQHIFATSPIQAEVRALWLALKDIMNISNRLDVMTDSVEIIKAIMDQGKARVEIKALIEDVIQLVDGFDFFCISKVPRIQVARAHNLAIQARKRD